MTDLPPLREVIRKHGLSASKALGQNFLFDQQLLARIWRSGQLRECFIYRIVTRGCLDERMLLRGWDKDALASFVRSGGEDQGSGSGAARAPLAPSSSSANASTDASVSAHSVGHTIRATCCCRRRHRRRRRRQHHCATSTSPTMRAPHRPSVRRPACAAQACAAQRAPPKRAPRHRLLALCSLWQLSLFACGQ